ncbi:PREDICTED: uncharacterized protein LOC104703826 [Camelina sativa]|uniref:Uncharacterized protein LOC104703826 n=1 Tax=Camelina sativa TaxID=90675 RepID=A0ABM0SZ20_CAMSA|nr:PREDICTED: uncharacterized protein LOC104703826 [Camelina sativa]XP_010418207.1 PREDICTED: uncharacterized protein LOC104703826 [Camelina sativa]XP_019083650.1 PREDICTED: uncharacterized protein LOC104703826 [Camelina sativa]XP_019083651.1 PREDICTED: uncharacterized protein LOC104703826 [Camelina sativa]
MLAAYPSGTINKSHIPFCDFKTTIFGPLISSSVSPKSRVPWSNVECHHHSSFSPKGQIHHPRKWMLCRSRNNSYDEYRSSRNIAISILRRYRTVIERGEGETLKEFISAGVNAYALGCTDEDLRKELIAMKESGLVIGRLESYHGSTQTKSKISLSEIDECILWLSIVFITILCTPQPTVVRWSSTPSVSNEILTKWRGFCAVIANAYYIRGMAWLPVKTLQLEQMAVTGQTEEPSVVVSRMRLVFSTLEVVSPQWPQV